MRQELHGLIESVDKALIPELFKWTQELGGYFKRFKGGALSPWLKEPNPEEMDLEARATLAFFEVRSLLSLRESAEFGTKVDRSLSSVDNTAQTCGATASVVILQCLDSPTAPFFFAQKIALYVAHCGYVHRFFIKNSETEASLVIPGLSSPLKIIRPFL